MAKENDQKHLSGFNSLSVSITNIKSWDREKELHTTDEYFQHRNEVFRKRLESIAPSMILYCDICGFPDNNFLELHHKNGDHTDYREENLSLVCSLCHRTHHLGWVATDNLGELRYIPDVISNAKQKRGVLVALIYLNRYNLMRAAREAGLRRTDNEKVLEIYSKPNKTEQEREHEVAKFFAEKAKQGKQEQQKWEVLDPLKQLDIIDTIIRTEDMQNNFILQVEAERKKKKEAARKREMQGQDTPEEQPQPEQSLLNSQKEDKPEYLKTRVHLIDLLEQLESIYIRAENNTNPKKEENGFDLLFEQNKTAKNGQLCIIFNKNILAPFDIRLGYDLEERLEYYKMLGFSNAEELQQYEHNFRNQYK